MLAPAGERGALAGSGVVTLLAVLLSYAAFDDITTDTSASFHVEYAVLALCAAWCVVLGLALLTHRRLIAGALSLVVLAASLWGQHGVGPGTTPAWRGDYIAVVAALVWFALLSVWLVARAISYPSFRRL